MAASSNSSPSSSHPLACLPQELRTLVLDLLTRADLRALSLVCRQTYAFAAPLLWQEVTLTDCRTTYGPAHTADDVGGDGWDPDPYLDDHDDTPLIMKLCVLVNKPELAAGVRILNHTCHLPPPGLHHEMGRNTFNAQTLSFDSRTIKLIQLAVSCMKHVHTLRIIFGHPHITDALLRGFFAVDRPAQGCARIRRLWLEYCRIGVGLNPSLEYHPYRFPPQLDFSGLRSVCFRRLPMRAGAPYDPMAHHSQTVYSRGDVFMAVDDGRDGTYRTTMNHAYQEAFGRPDMSVSSQVADSLELYTPLHSGTSPFCRAPEFDRSIWKNIAQNIDLPRSISDSEVHQASQNDGIREDVRLQAYRGDWLDPDDLEGSPEHPAWKRRQLEKYSSPNVAVKMLRLASSSLTSLRLDGLLTEPNLTTPDAAPAAFRNWVSIFADLFACRFPHLQTFQLRNCVTTSTALPHGLYLLDHSHVTPEKSAFERRWPDLSLHTINLGLAGLEFVEAHPGLKSLAWPMHRFVSARALTPEVRRRIETVAHDLGYTLEMLRVEHLWGSATDIRSEELKCADLDRRECRRRFISLFAAHLRKLRIIKVAGSVPRDERRELLRALRICPLEQVVMIQRMYPLGNGWGLGAQWQYQINGVNVLESENSDAVSAYAATPQAQSISAPSLPDDVYASQHDQPLSNGENAFQAQYGWAWDAPPLLATLIACHASTLTSLRIRGANGAPIFFHPDPITEPLLGPLKAFHNLRELHTTCLLDSAWEGEFRHKEITSYWQDSRSPSSKALVVIPDPAGHADEPNTWAQRLRNFLAPHALAEQTVKLFGPVLSDQAKSRPGGIRVTVAFYMCELENLHNLDCWIGRRGSEDVCLSFRGPREELDPELRREKLVARRWF